MPADPWLVGQVFVRLFLGLLANQHDQQQHEDQNTNPRPEPHSLAALAAIDDCADPRRTNLGS